MNSLSDISVAVSRSKRVLICGHIMPDGDCIGSVLALGLTLERLGKEVTMAGPDPVPAIYDFLPGLDRFLVGDPPEGSYDTLIVLDCSLPERIGKSFQKLLSQNMVIINIDHHAGHTAFGMYSYVDPRAAAVGEIIFDLFNLMQVKMSVEAAICLYTAIITDTGSFQFSNTTSGTHRRVSQLLDAGVPAAQINIRLYEEKPRAFHSLLGAALNTLSISPCGKVCWMTVTSDMMRNCRAEDEHSEGLVNYTRSIRGVEVGLLFREMTEGGYKVSFRSKNVVNVNQLATQFGGGGHPRAAGCIMQGDLEEIREKVIMAAVSAAGGV